MNSNREAIEQAAAGWISRRDSGEWTHDDQARLDGWMRESPAHATVFLRLDHAWGETARLKALSAGFSPGTIPSREALAASPLAQSANAVVTTRRRFSMPWAAAAGVLLAVALSVAGYVVFRGPSYSTSIGGLEGISMSDGSHVTLNTDTRVRLAVSDSERRVDLKRGEAFFEVAKDSSRPFFVVAGGYRIVAVGTKFSVWSSGEGTRIVVSEGRVRLDSTSGSAPIELSAGSIARTGPDGVRVQESTEAVERYLSWRSGFVTFLDTPLSEAVAEFNRYNTQQLYIEDAELARLRIDGNFRSTNVNAFLRLLEGGFPVQIERRGRQIVMKAEH